MSCLIIYLTCDAIFYTFGVICGGGGGGPAITATTATTATTAITATTPSTDTTCGTATAGTKYITTTKAEFINVTNSPSCNRAKFSWLCAAFWYLCVITVRLLIFYLHFPKIFVHIRAPDLTNLKTLIQKIWKGSIIAWLFIWLFVWLSVCHAHLMGFSRLPLTSQSRQVQSKPS